MQRTQGTKGRKAKKMGEKQRNTGTKQEKARNKGTETKQEGKINGGKTMDKHWHKTWELKSKDRKTRSKVKENRVKGSKEYWHIDDEQKQTKNGESNERWVVAMKTQAKMRKAKSGGTKIEAKEVRKIVRTVMMKR